MPRKSATEKSECFIHENIPDKEKEFIRQEVCRDLPVKYGSFKPNGELYCILHFPNRYKEEFDLEFQQRLEEESYDFRGVYFPDFVKLSNKTFYEMADFSFATFTQSTEFFSTKFTKEVKFIAAAFLKDINFNSAFFYDDALFGSAKFYKNAYFTNTEFIYNADFRSVIFEDKSQTFFLWTNFEGVVDFSFATFKGYVAFVGEKESTVFIGKDTELNLQNARLEKPERISFKNVLLRPSWFINTDPRKFIFTNIQWKNLEKFDVLTEIKNLEKVRKISDSKHVLTVACRQLATNYEENNRFEEASKFRRMGFEVEWAEKKETLWNWLSEIPNESEKLKKRVGGSESKEHEAKPPTNLMGIVQRFDFVHLLYRISSYYGESWQRALAILLSILIIFSLYYYLANFQICPKNSDNKSACVVRTMNINEAIQQSLYTAALQNVEYRKTLTSEQDIIILLEKILAPLQAALLALAIRRKFMR